MDGEALFPFVEDSAWMLRYSKLPLHEGVGSVVRHGGEDQFSRLIAQMRQPADRAEPNFNAGFFVPPSGDCLVLLRSQDESRLGRNFGEGLTVVGESPEGPYRLFCPSYYIKSVSPLRERPGWAVAVPTDQPAIVSYGEPRPVEIVTATINNFDFAHGNQADDRGRGRAEVLRIEAAGRTVDFAWRSGRSHLRRLLETGVIGTTSLATFTFAAWPRASDDELMAFAHNVSSLCSYVVGQHTGIPVISLYDAEGRVVRRILRGVVESRFRAVNALPVMHADRGLPRLFRQCFEEHCRMQQSDQWRRLAPLYAAMEDPPYLEQKYATLMMAVELFIRNSAIEGGHLSPTEAERKTLPELVGLARGTLGWNVPGHYTQGERYRKTRNAVDHGGLLPHAPVRVRADFDKWKLFLCRRIFIRLGFDGQVASPESGWASSSPVDEFSEEHNSFGP